MGKKNRKQIEEQDNNEGVQVKKSTLRSVLAIIFMVGVVIVIAYAFSQMWPFEQPVGGLVPYTGEALTENDAEARLNWVLNDVLLPEGTNAVIESFEEESGLWRGDVLIDNQALLVHMSIDGKYLFPQAIDILQIELEDDPTTIEPVPPPSDVEINLEGVRGLGDPNAPVVMVEWSDFRCPFCQRFWQETLPSIKEAYVDTGQVYFVYKDFPVVGGENEAHAAWCAYEQDAFWEYHDVLFENLQQGSMANFLTWAEELGLDRDAFEECMQTGRYEDNVIEEAREGQMFGVTGTPGFYINGELLAGAQPFEAFQAVIEEHLEN